MNANTLFAITEGELSKPEAAQLAILEQTIERGLKIFVDVGTALMVVRDSKLYRQGYSTFEDYCRVRWNMGKSRVYQMIDAAIVVENLKSSTNGGLLPDTERQARPLAQLEPEQQREAWDKAIEISPNGKPTAAIVQRVIDEYEQQAEELLEDKQAYDWTEDEPVTTPTPQIITPVTPITPADSIDSSLDSDEWYTPIELIEAARAVMDGISLDPASSHEAQKVVNATVYYTQDEDGLAQEWLGRGVWLNPPYSAPRPWVEKLIESLEAGSIESAILLVNTANSPLWARPLWHGPYTVCLLDKRVRFWRPDRPDAKGFDRDQMIWYLGCNVGKFREVFSSYGAIR